MLALAACAGGAGDAPELLRVRSLVPDALVAGSTVRLQGEGFPIARDGQIHFHGECTSPGERARPVSRDTGIAELEKLKTEPITPGELQRAKNQFARDYIVGRESNQDKALHLAHAAVIHNDITTADGEFDIFMNTTAADVQRVARTYFTPENRVVITIMPKGAGR